MSFGDTWTGEAPRNVLSPSTIAAALANAAASQSMHAKPAPPSRSQTSYSKSSSSSSSSSGVKAAWAPKHKDCACIDCRDPGDRDRLGTLSKNKDGDTVLEHNSSQSVPLGIHCQAGQWRDDPNASKPAPPRRSSTHGSLNGGSKRRTTQRTYTRDANGNMVEEHGGSEAPSIYVHLNPLDPTHKNLRDDDHSSYDRR
ncbi:hypothetical protein FPQ18DRAFT_345139 [Pyronema domesticum]|uniref:Uncharacterized protein n=1 Tax=Pyronema omphalodes (strain CBS 100304) TaxID=1076935 RepID=U4LHJ4_PYROM|nr:hypothetical protein FPQ18DRAFT_345139 [Pyronema domesticum]CCX31007.1 Protein of unknown function [Pyronema omphalodes CBS 100304]